MNKTKIGICTIGAVAILAGSCMIGSTYAANRTKADQRVTATAVRAVEPSNDTLKKRSVGLFRKNIRLVIIRKIYAKIILRRVVS